ncbi:MAG TPA: hypothetical protein VGS06_17535 [Streptosporangiaceae bacterium]|nr:hypothetical protein [Streptosporangiaceae bacterium]
MPSYIQIEGDPAKWWIEDQFPVSELTGGQPLSVTSLAPIEGVMVLSARSATVAVLNVPSGSPPAPLAVPGEFIYVPTAAGPSAGHVGYQVADGADAVSLSSQVAAAMHGGQSLTIALAGGGTLVLNGATLAFAVLGPIGLGGATPHG